MVFLKREQWVTWADSRAGCKERRVLYWAGGRGLGLGLGLASNTALWQLRGDQRKCISTAPKGRRMFIVQSEDEALPARVWPWVREGGTCDACWLGWGGRGGVCGREGVRRSRS